jgi:hypothetical protein
MFLSYFQVENCIQYHIHIIVCHDFTCILLINYLLIDTIGRDKSIWIRPIFSINFKTTSFFPNIINRIGGEMVSVFASSAVDRGKNISDIQTKVQEDLNRIELWCKEQSKNSHFKMKNYTWLNSEQLQHSACEKLLGIKIHSNLNWKNQIDQVPIVLVVFYLSYKN